MNYYASISQLNEAADRLNIEIDNLLTRLDAVEAERDAARAERDAARAGEARALEALTHGRSLAQKVVGETWDLAGSFTDKEQALFDWVEDLDWPRYPTPALDWLAQQRAEAALKELEEILVGGNHLASALTAYFGDVLPPYGTNFDEARRAFAGPNEYNLWVCWAVMMRVRDSLKVGGNPG